MNRYLTIGVLAVLLAISAGCSNDETEEYVEPLTNVQFYMMKHIQFVQDISLPIVVLPSKEVNLGLTNGGRVTKINVDKGSRVSTGQVLLETDDVLLKVQLESAEATLEYQKSEFDRAERLLADGSITQAQYDGAKLALSQAESNYQSTKKMLDEASLKAPFSGIVTSRTIEIGDMLSPGTPAFRIINMDRVKIQAGIPEKYITDFEIGNLVTFTIDAIPGRQYDAKLNFLSPEANSTVRTFLAEMEVDNSDGAIRAGVMGNASIRRKVIPDALMLPLNAVIETENGSIVFVLNSNNTVTSRPITMKGSSDTMLWIDGLEAGERIIVLGQHDLVNGELVNVTGEYTPSSDEENQE